MYRLKLYSTAMREGLQSPVVERLDFGIGSAAAEMDKVVCGVYGLGAEEVGVVALVA